MRFGAYIPAIALAIAFMAPAVSHARPLRIWVMNNEAGVGSPEISEGEIRAGLEKWKKEGIIIENSVNNLLIPSETKYPLASHVIGDNNFIRQLADYRKESGDDRPIAIEFIRWDDAYNRITSALSSGDVDSAPDVAQVGHSWALDLANMGKVADLRGHIEERAFHPSPMISGSITEAEELFAVPWFTEMRLLYFHRSSVPSAEAISDWDSFSRTCVEYTDRHGKPFIGFSTAINWNLLHNLAPWLWAAGGDIVRTREIGPVTIPSVAVASPESIAGMTYLKRLSESGCAVFPNITQEMVDRRFVEGEYAAVITGPWVTKIMGDGWRRRFGIAGMPSGPGGSQPFVGGSHLIVSQASKERGNFARAASLVRYLVSPGSQLRFNRISGFYPVNGEALEEFLKSDGNEHFMKAVERGLSYPHMQDWGGIVENEFIRSHLWHIWRDIAQGVPDETLKATARNAAQNLRSKLIMAQARRASPYAAAALAGAFAIIAAALAWSRARYRRTRALYEANAAELVRIHAEQTVLEGKALLLERRKDEQSDELASLRGKLCALSRRAEELKVLLAKSSPKKAGDEKRIGPFAIGWDGSLVIRGEKARFDNNRQARRLIEQLVRGACAGQFSIHCLWGYPLFGWRPETIHSHPQRLFEIMIAKINSGLKSFGAPPIARKSGKGTLSWRLAWDAELVLANSGIKKASKEAEFASAHLDEDEVETACTHAIIALELDPKNLEALATAAEILSSRNAAQPYGSRMKSMLRISESIVAREIDALREGIIAVEQVLSGKELPKGMNREMAEEELGSMRHAEEYLSNRFKSIFKPDSGTRRSALFDEIMGRLSAVRSEIVAFKSRGASSQTLWAQVAGSASFSQLLAVPHISSMVGDFYNEEIHGKEDPRLVKLALISVLSRHDSIEEVDSAKDGRALVKRMTKAIRQEIGALSNDLECISLS